MSPDEQWLADRGFVRDSQGTWHADTGPSSAALWLRKEPNAWVAEMKTDLFSNGYPAMMAEGSTPVEALRRLDRRAQDAFGEFWSYSRAMEHVCARAAIWSDEP